MDRGAISISFTGIASAVREKASLDLGAGTDMGDRGSLSPRAMVSTVVGIENTCQDQVAVRKV